MTRLLPAAEEAIERLIAPDQSRMIRWALRPSARGLSRRDHIFTDAGKAGRFFDDLALMPLGAIAIDTEFQFGAPPVDLGRRRQWRDLSSLTPLILSGAAWSPRDGVLIRFAVDMRAPDMAAAIGRLLRIRAVFVAHYIMAEFQTFWAAGIDPVLHQTYCTYVAARALLLGRDAPELVRLRRAKEREDADAIIEAETAADSLLSLAGQARLYDVEHPHLGAKEALQNGFLDHPGGAAFSNLQWDYAMADAEATLGVYLAQQADVTAAGLHAHLHQVEFPFAEANARMEWTGVHAAPDRLAQLRRGLSGAVAGQEGRLREAGLDNPRSTKQVERFLINRGHQDRLLRRGKVTTEDGVLEALEPLDPMVTDLRRHSRYSRLLADPLFTGAMTGTDGRLHPRHRHLGADTGRSTCSAPNIVGISKTFRPVVTAPEGRGLVELDFAQIEVGIAAAEHGDAGLIEAFNTGDVYAAVARSFYDAELSEEERGLSLTAFKRARPDLRNRIKVFVLASLYNISDQGIADRFGKTLAEARAEKRAFLDAYPAVRAGMEHAERDGRVRGWSPIIGGLRRSIPGDGRAANRHINTPVQAGAGVVFRKAVVDLYRAFRGGDADLVLPIHDAVLIECALADLDKVAGRAAAIMEDAVRTYYPELRPRVDTNRSDPGCWNKDGCSNSLDRFLMDPDYKV